MQSYLKGKLKEIDRPVEDHEKDTSEHIDSDISSPDIDLDIRPEDLEFDITTEHNQIEANVTDYDVDVGILEQIDADIISEEIDTVEPVLSGHPFR